MWDPINRRTVWRLLVVYASQDRTRLMGQLVGNDGTKLGSAFQIYAGERVRAPQVAWHGDVWSGQWVVAFEAAKQVGGLTVGNIFTAVVSWSGSVVTVNDVALCEENCSPVLARSGGAIEENGDCICKGMWLAAAPYGQPHQHILHEYQWDHLLGSNGQRLSTVSFLDYFHAVAPTAAAGMQFQQVANECVRGYDNFRYAGVRHFPPDTNPLEDPWDDGRQATQWFQVSGEKSTKTLWVRKAGATAGLLHSKGWGEPMFLSVISDP